MTASNYFDRAQDYGIDTNGLALPFDLEYVKHQKFDYGRSYSKGFVTASRLYHVLGKKSVGQMLLSPFRDCETVDDYMRRTGLT